MTEQDDLTRFLAGWLADVADNGPVVVRHGSSCGERQDAPCGNMDLSPRRPAERMGNGTVICHRCGLSFRPGEPPLCGRTPAR